MEFPDEILRIIREYSRPIGRPWKKGSYLHQHYRDPHSTLTADLMYHAHSRCCRVGSTDDFKRSYRWFIDNHSLWKRTKYSWCYGKDIGCQIS